MSLELRFFASLRESLGAGLSLTLVAPARIGDVRDQLIARGEPFAGALARGRAVRCALNKTMCAEDALVRDGDELAFFPPVTGG